MSNKSKNLVICPYLSDCISEEFCPHSIPHKHTEYCVGECGDKEIVCVLCHKPKDPV